MEGTREVTSTLEDEQMEAQIYINRNKASLYGLNMQTIAGALAKVVVQSRGATENNAFAHFCLIMCASGRIS